GHQAILPGEDLSGVVSADLTCLAQAPEPRQPLAAQVHPQSEVLSRAPHHAAVAGLPALRALDAEEIGLGRPSPRGKVPEGNRGRVQRAPFFERGLWFRHRQLVKAWKRVV